MCVLQDFEALTPNLLARTVETVEGGGLVVLLLSSLDSLSKLYTMAMDVHSRFRTESHQQVTGRFNERFMLSLAGCPSAIFMDDELNILPLSSHVRTLVPIGPGQEADAEGEICAARWQTRSPRGRCCSAAAVWTKPRLWLLFWMPSARRRCGQRWR
jgi:N-acetyltransferase 10